MSARWLDKPITVFGYPLVTQDIVVRILWTLWGFLAGYVIAHIIFR